MSCSITVKGFARKDFRRANPGPLRKYVQGYFNALWRDALNDFIRGAAVRIAVDTGMSMASLSKVASMANRQAILEAILHNKGPRQPDPNYDEYKGPEGGIKSIPLGREIGEQGTFVKFAKKDRATMYFAFHVMVFQYEENEKYWNSVAGGRAAFEKRLDKGPTGKPRLYIGKALEEYFKKGRLPADIQVGYAESFDDYDDSEVPF